MVRIYTQGTRTLFWKSDTCENSNAIPRYMIGKMQPYASMTYVVLTAPSTTNILASRVTKQLSKIS